MPDRSSGGITAGSRPASTCNSTCQRSVTRCPKNCCQLGPAKSGSGWPKRLSRIPTTPINPASRALPFQSAMPRRRCRASDLGISAAHPVRWLPVSAGSRYAQAGIDLVVKASAPLEIRGDCRRVLCDAEGLTFCSQAVRSGSGRARFCCRIMRRHERLRFRQRLEHVRRQLSFREARAQLQPHERTRRVA